MGTHDVSTFIVFSKSESSIVSLKASMMAALAACKTSRPAGGASALGCAGESPSRRNTSQIRSCAGNGIERLNRVRYHLGPKAVASIPCSS